MSRLVRSLLHCGCIPLSLHRMPPIHNNSCMIYIWCYSHLFYLVTALGFTYNIYDPHVNLLNMNRLIGYPIVVLSQGGDSPFVYRDRAGWPALPPYICKIHVSVAIGTQSRIIFTKGCHWSNYGGPQKSDNGKVVKSSFLQFFISLLLLFCFSSNSRISKTRES